MFHLATPITSARPVSDFDDIGTIITHSSLTSSKKAAPWQKYVQEDGQVFFIELTKATRSHTHNTRKTDVSSVCSMCSTRSCRSCASEDTGYSSDADTQSTQSKNRRSGRSLLDFSHDSLSVQSKVADSEDDDGVSEDLWDIVRIDETRTTPDRQHDAGDPHEQVTRRCNKCKSRSLNGPHRALGSTRTSSLCKRHSSKFSNLETSRFGSNPVTDLPLVCKYGGESTLKDNLQFGEKEVLLRVRSVQHKWDSRSSVSWLETALGIVPGRVDSHLTQPGIKTEWKDRVTVKGLAPDGPAVKTNNIAIGDVLLNINGRQITWNNLDIVLSSLHQTRKIRLTVGKPSDVIEPSPVGTTLTDYLVCSTSDVLKVLSHPLMPVSYVDGVAGDGVEDVCVIYMSMDGVDAEDKREKKDVIYQFPQEDSTLSKLRGCFFTLDHLLADAAHTHVRISTVNVHGSLINVACCKEGGDMLIVAAPDNRMKSSPLLTVTNGLVRLVRFLYGSVEEAFHHQQNHLFLDELMSCQFNLLQPAHRGMTRIQAPSHDYMTYLPLPDDDAIPVSNTITEYESADVSDLMDTYSDCRRTFTVLGSMVLYKGHMICCHLPPEDVKDVSLYLHHSGLLSLSATHSPHQLLVWREIFPTRLCHEVAGINSVFGYSEPHARWFLMVVGAKNMLIASVLEAGGYATQCEGVCQPDPFYVDQARAALVQLNSSEIVTACEIRLCGDGLPATTTADQLISPLESSVCVQAPDVGSCHHCFGDMSVSPAHGLDAGKLWGEWNHSSFESSKVGIMFKDRHVQNNRKKHNPVPPSSLGSAGHHPGLVLDSDINTYKLSAGKENTLMMFCQVNQQEGVVIMSSGGGETASWTSSLHRQVQHNFQRCVAQIHTDFMKDANIQVYPSEGVLEDFHGDSCLNFCREEGVMFTCSLGDRSDGKKSPNSLVYWVVGRKFRNQNFREIFVCFHESTSQSVIDLAFRLSLGSSAT